MVNVPGREGIYRVTHVEFSLLKVNSTRVASTLHREYNQRHPSPIITPTDYATTYIIKAFYYPQASGLSSLAIAFCDIR